VDTENHSVDAPRREMMKPPKNKEREYRHIIAKLKREGRMPTLDQVIESVAQARLEYGPRLRKARRENSDQRKVVN
jgi:hypothetical protein